MKDYSEVTPVTQLLDKSFDLDQLRSSYVNIRFEVALAEVITIDAAYQANLPGLAYDYYGDQSYWRAILAFNGLTDPINDITVGVRLGMPDASSLNAYLASTNNTLVETLYV